jgi:hypothetical protein
MDIDMTAENNTWQARLRRGAVQGLVFAVIFYLLIESLDRCIPSNAYEVSVGDVILYWARMYFILMGVVATASATYDWFISLKKFLLLRRTQKKSMR